MTHSHAEGLYSSACRACRLLGHLETSRATTGYSVARELVGCHLWSRGQRRALRMVATLGINAMDLSAWVEAASKEVEG